MDKKVTKKTIWPQFRIAVFTKSDEGIEGAESLGLLLSKFALLASPLIFFGWILACAGMTVIVLSLMSFY